jgi:hypothetical protein
MEPFLEIASQRRIIKRKQKRRTVQRSRKSSFYECKFLGSEKGNTTFSQQMVECTNVRTGARRRVGQDHINIVHGQICKQMIRPVFTTDKVDGDLQSQRGFN